MQCDNLCSINPSVPNWWMWLDRKKNPSTKSAIVQETSVLHAESSPPSICEAPNYPEQQSSHIIHHFLHTSFMVDHATMVHDQSVSLLTRSQPSNNQHANNNKQSCQNSHNHQILQKDKANSTFLLCRSIPFHNGTPTCPRTFSHQEAPCEQG